jgi:hypothetical protein
MKNAKVKKCTKPEKGSKDTSDKSALVRDWKKIDKAAEYLRKTSKSDANWHELLGRTNESNA